MKPLFKGVAALQFFKAMRYFIIALSRVIDKRFGNIISSVIWQLLFAFPLVALLVLFL